ncbi:MAG: TolC family protein [Myxococcota bacterium]|nr:TolC family protein [Myxococcota bacterium]
MEQNPELRALRGRRGLARAEIIAAGVLPNPVLAGHFSFPLAGAEATVYGAGADLSWDATSLLGLGARIESAEADYDAVDLEVAWQEWQVAVGARLHALRAVSLGHRIEVAEQIARTWQERTDALERAQGSGATTALEVRDATLLAAEARMALQALRRERAVELAALATAIGADPADVPALRSASEVRADLPALERLLDGLPERRLDLIALRHRYRGRGAALDAAHAGAFPPIQIGVFVNQEVDENLSAGPTLSIQIPVFDRNQAQIARAEAAREQTADEYEARLRQARNDVVALEHQRQSILRELEAATLAAAAAADLAERGRRAHAGGALTLLQVHEIERRAWAATLRQLELEQLAGDLRVGLAVASGRPF